MDKLFTEIPRNRLVVYLLVIGLLPLVFALNSAMSYRLSVRQAQSRLASTYQKVVLNQSKLSGNNAVIDMFSTANHRYIDQQVESISLMSRSLEALQELLEGDQGVVDEKLAKRYTLLKNTNKLLFSEGSVVSYPTFQETLETLVNPVLVDEADIQTILSRTEGVDFGSGVNQKGRPQLIVTKFRLDRQEEEDVFMLNLQLLKREYL